MHPLFPKLQWIRSWQAVAQLNQVIVNFTLSTVDSRRRGASMHTVSLAGISISSLEVVRTQWTLLPITTSTACKPPPQPLHHSLQWPQNLGFVNR